MFGNSLSLGLLKSGKPVKVSVLGEHPDAPAARQSLPVHQLDIRRLDRLLLTGLCVAEER